MAIEIRIPKEINRYEAKFIGPFTLRQILSLGICLPIGIFVYNIVKPFVGTDLAGFMVIPFGALAWAFGWYKPYGIRFEKYLKTIFVSTFLAPSKRVYKTENYYASILEEIKKADNPTLPDSQGKSSGKNKKKARAKKYKRSKLAIR